MLTPCPSLVRTFFEQKMLGASHAMGFVPTSISYTVMADCSSIVIDLNTICLIKFSEARRSLRIVSSINVQSHVNLINQDYFRHFQR